MKPLYRHTQYSNWVLAILGLALLLIVVLIFITNYHPAAVAAFVPVAAILAIFHAMTVEVDSEQVKLHFGIGWPRATIPLDQIRDVCIVHNSPGASWGIRLIPNGVLYRLAGSETVELVLSEGRVARIGSDEPQELAKAIEDALLARKRK